MDKIYLDVNTLSDFIKQTFIKAGVPSADADIVVDVLIRSDLRGIESHGIGRLGYYLNFFKLGVINPVTDYRVINESPGTAVIDGNNGVGHVIAYHAMKLAIAKAKKVGVAAVAVKNSSHFGICGYYPLMAIKENMAGLAFTNARPAISPTFGKDPMFGTNPIAFGVPTDEDCPFLLDMATSITQRGKIEVLNREGKPTPAGWAIDTAGNPVTDSAALLEMFGKKEASLLPLGGAGEELAGYKGYGLAAMVEIFAAAFSGGPFCWGVSGVKDDKKVPTQLGHFFIVFNIKNFINVDIFKKITGDLVRTLRASGKLPRQDRIWTAGEKEYDHEQEIPTTGVPINETLQKEMKEIKKEYELEIELPF